MKRVSFGFTKDNIGRKGRVAGKSRVHCAAYLILDDLIESYVFRTLNFYIVGVEMCRTLELQLIINSRMLRNVTVILNYIVLSMLRNCSMNLAV